MIGKILGGRYEILERIGGGGMALVYKARCQLLDRLVAVKVLKDEFVNDEEFVRQFRRESQAAASLSHPNIVNIYDVGVETDGNNIMHYIVMEYINGGTLKDLIIESGKLSIEDTINYSNQIAEALENAHKNNIVHRDIKPQNIMITEDNRVKVTDFGIARAATSSTATTRLDVLGSVHYFSPEQARGGYTDEKSDIYSLGIVMYEMITGDLPYKGDSPITVALKHVQEEIVPPRELDIKIPKGLENIILKSVQKRQADRYGNIGELIRDLKNVKMNPTVTRFDDFNDTESHTRMIPIVNVEDDYNMKNDKKNKKGKKKVKKDGSGKVIFLGILLAFLLASGLFWGSLQLKGLFSSSEIIMPKLVGLQEDDARKAIEDLGLEFNVKTRVKNSEFAAGEVAWQSVDPDTMLKKGYPVDVTISEGDDLVKVPKLENEDILDAEELLTDIGLKIGKVDYEYSDDIPIDVVISQTPRGESEVETGSRVNVILSQGPENKTVLMPKLTDLKLADAKKKIKELDLSEGDIIEEPNEKWEKGIVFWQSYNQGTPLEKKTAVDLYVSTGPKEVIDDGNGGSGGDNDNESDKEGPITFTLSPLADKDETEIKIIRTQDGVSKVVYNKKHSIGEGDITRTLEGKKGAQFDVYYDDNFVDTWIR